MRGDGKFWGIREGFFRESWVFGEEGNLRGLERGERFRWWDVSLRVFIEYVLGFC